MRDWVQTTVGDVITLQRGFDITRRNQSAGDIPVISSGGISSYHDQWMAEGPGVVIGRKGTLGTVFYTTSRYWPHDTTLWVKDFKGNAPRFVYYFLKQLDVRGLDVGSANPALNRNHVHPLPICWPERLADQNAIAAVLGALDDKIAANSVITQTEGKLLQALFAESIACGRSQVRPFFDAVEVRFGEAFKGSEFCPVGVGRPLIRIRDLRTNRCQVWTKESRPKEELIRPGDLLAGMDAEFRPSSWTGEPGLLNQRVCKLSSPLWGNALLREVVRAPLLEIERAKSATTVIHLNKSDLARSVVIAPSQSNSDRLNATMQPIYDHSVLLARENCMIAELRDTLLPALMSGRLLVKDAERRVEDAV